jgi:hypothetical protein
LVLAIVYATNTEKLNELFGRKNSDVSSNAEVEMAAADYSGSPSEFAQQIGDNLDGFLLDQDFFDETEKVQSVVVIKKNSSDVKESPSSAAISSTKEMEGTGMAVVGELINPGAEGVDPSTLDSNLFEYNGQMPATPPETGTPVGTTPGN